MEHIAAKGDLVQFGHAPGIGKREIGDRRILGRDYIYRSERNRLVREGVHDRGLDLPHPLLKNIVIENEYLRPGGHPQAQHE